MVRNPLLAARRGVARHFSLNLPAKVVVGLTSIGLLALVADMPRRDEPTYGVPRAEFRLDAPGVEPVLLESRAEYEVRIPIRPGGNARLTGVLSVFGVSPGAGELDITVVMPEPTTLRFVDVQPTGPGEHTWRLVPAAEQEPGEFNYPSGPPVSVGQLRLRTDEPCVQWFVRIEFETSHPTFSRSRGLGRQEVHFDLAAAHWDWTEEESRRVEAQQQCGLRQGEVTLGPGHVLLETAPQQEVVSSLPSPDRVFEDDLQWLLPLSRREQPTTVVRMENSTVRYWVDLAQQLLFVAVGALLGSVSVTRRKRGESASRT